MRASKTDKPTAAPKRWSARSSARDRSLLTGLLVVIAVLLGLVIALLPSPRSVDRGALAIDSPVTHERSVGGEAATQGGGSTDGAPPLPDAAARPGEGATQGAGTDATATERLVTTTTITGAIPPAGATSEGVGAAALEPRYWWLPDDPPEPAVRGRLHLVLDDAGNAADDLSAFLPLPVPFTLAVLPGLPYSRDAALKAARAGKEVILHQPMEALNGADPGPGWIGPSHDDGEIVRTLITNLESVPGAIGANNHMGSRATADDALMRSVLGFLHERGYFYLDSRTSAQTVARSVAAEVGIPFVERNVFLDNVRERDAILSAVAGALELSVAGTDVIMIGHVTVPLLAEVLAEVVAVVIDHGYRFGVLADAVSDGQPRNGERGE